MVAKLFASGDLRADRRAEFAETLAHLGDIDAAVDVLRGALEIVPTWGAGWFRLGEYLERAGDRDGAAKAWGRAVQEQPDDPFGAGLRRDLLRDQPLSDTMPPAFVEMLFDQYAPRFEASLLEHLDYQGPQIIEDAVAQLSDLPVERALDLGCGTGLIGPVLRPHCTHLTGIDLSQAMLEEARAKGVYDVLEKADIQDMPISPDRYGLIVASDVFNYLGALERIVGWCAASLSPDGALIFTVEQAQGRDVTLRSTRRFAHGRDYLVTLLDQAGFARVELCDVVLRQDRGADVRGFCVRAEVLRGQGRSQGDGEAQVPMGAV
ncbi:methyltransferase domain-containing protein [Marivita geojedonensis]|uniref:methyltransferase domain-containing protein n=1 Tax=Marivita geojedonensis TaxID=1123756 RepID=UPI000A1DEAEE|nr:methyltransferase domain-containing protein [Marivita geojedonensis]PRY77018.1 putative TPR repeat methyltransferase [Marivita geojedonensis]